MTPDWKRFWTTLFRTALGLIAFLYLLVVLIDPYDTLAISPPADRYPVTTNQRYSYPAIAMSADYDSAVIGTSTSRLLKPDFLNSGLGGRFANLSFNSGQAYEQWQIADLFLRHHPNAKHVIIGIDNVWCDPNIAPKFTERPFPPWLYDDIWWNDFSYLLNPSALEEAGRQLGQMLGLRDPKYQKNGYRNFLPPMAEYDLEKARTYLYGAGPRTLAPPEEMPEDTYRALLERLRFPQLPYLRSILDAIPAETEITVLFVPLHHLTIGTPGTEQWVTYDECKKQIASLLAGRANTHMLDFMFRSRFTLEDTNYWDTQHYTEPASRTLVQKLIEGVTTKRGDPDYFRYVDLTPS